MASLAIIIGDGMAVGLSVTIRASPVDLRVIDRKNILPIAARRMASTAHIGGISMVGRLIIGMAILTTTDDLIVIYGKHHIPGCPRTMAGFTHIGRVGVIG